MYVSDQHKSHLVSQIFRSGILDPKSESESKWEMWKVWGKLMERVCILRFQFELWWISMQSSISLLADDDNITFLWGPSGLQDLITWLKMIFTKFLQYNQPSFFWKRVKSLFYPDFNFWNWPKFPHIFSFLFDLCLQDTDSGQSQEGLLIRQALSAYPNHCFYLPTRTFTKVQLIPARSE